MKVQMDYFKDVSKDLPKQTFHKWKTTGKDILQAHNSTESCRSSYKQSVDRVEFEKKAMERIRSSKTDVEGVAWLRHTNLRHLFGKSCHQKKSDLSR